MVLAEQESNPNILSYFLRDSLREHNKSFFQEFEIYKDWETKYISEIQAV